MTRSTTTIAAGDFRSRRNAEPEISNLWWLYLPILFFLLRYLVHLISDYVPGLESAFRNELGLVENLTVAILIAALIYTLMTLRRYRHLIGLPMKLFLVFYSLGCIYFAGEEASWGQHWFGWETSEYFRGINDQQETNFHNTSKWLDRVPKGLISLGIFIGGILVPAWLSYKNRRIDYGKPIWWLWPTSVCLPTAILATIATWPSKIERAIDWKFYFDQAQEMKEFYIALFILLFIVSLARRVQLMQVRGRHFSPV